MTRGPSPRQCATLAMTFAFAPSAANASRARARCGTIAHGDGARTPTPTALAPTSKGEHATLTKDVLDDVETRLRAALRARRRANDDGTSDEGCLFGCALVGAHFARKTKRGTKRKRDGDEAEGEEAEGDEAACPPPRRLTLGHYRDSMYFGMNAQNRSGADALACETPYGQRSLDAREYARIWRSGAAHAAVSLADEHGGWESAKKSKTAAIRTCAWLDACAKEAKTLRLPLFGALTGGEHAEVREECSRRVAERDDDVVGYALSGFFAGEDVSTRGACIEASLKHIPSEKPRYLSGTTTVEDIVDNIDRGVDVFDASWASETAQRGRAFCFPVDEEDDEMEAEDAESRATSGSDAYSINIWSTSYKTDFTPFIRGDRCRCPACAEHTRAYVHHLLQAHEMTADVLLEAHNLYHIAAFFAAARRAIRCGRWQEFAAFHRAYAQRARET